MRQYVILAAGIAVCLTGAALMAFGRGLLGENHTGIAAMIGIIGIGIIGMSAAISAKRSSEETKSSTGGA